MLAFEGDERSDWAVKLMHKFQPRPRGGYSSTGDKYFSGGLSVPSTAIFSGEAKEKKNILELRSFFDRAASLCAKFNGLCGRKTVVYRSSVDGHAILPGDDAGRLKPIPFPRRRPRETALRTIR